MIKTLHKGTQILFAGELQFGITEKEDEKHAWLGLTIKSMQFNGEKKLGSENDAKSTSSKDAKANKSKSKQTSEPTPSHDDAESDEEDDDDLPF